MSIIDDIISTNIKYRKGLGIDKKITFGTELEFENAPYLKVDEDLKNNSDLNNWSLKNEETVMFFYDEKMYGGELVSPILSDDIRSWKQLKEACILIKNNIGLIHQKAGSHIHIGKQILKDNRDYIINFIKLWCIYEHIIYRFAYGEKSSPRKTLDMYAAACSLRLHESILEIEKNKEKYSDYHNIYNYLYDTFETGIGLRKGLFFACSSHNDKQKDTIEIRCPNGTLNEKIWQNNINFFVKLMFYATRDKFDKEFIDEKFKNYKHIYANDYSNIYLEDATELANLIFESDIDKLYFLKQYLKIEVQNYQKIKEKIIVNNK